ncbi:MAG: DNA internalization-related competence protein ComEC/Rec2 [Desulfobulbus propionicus]|nr:MAG: DNA internalization-related competence protein ComEC/Rec2 [Desulfobulbus propionicus]
MLLWQQILFFLRYHLLIWVTLAYMAGGALSFNLLHSSVSPQLAWHTCLALFVLLLLAALRFSRCGPVAAMILFLALGSAMTLDALQGPVAKQHIRFVVTTKMKATVTGSLIKMVEFDGERSRLWLDLKAILPASGSKQTEPSFQETTGIIRLSVQGALPPTFKAGDIVMALATLAPVHSFQTPGAFDYSLYMKERGVFVTGWVVSGHHILKVKEEPSSSFLHSTRYIPEQIRQYTAGFLDTHCAPETAGIYKALLLGYRGGIQTQVLEHFKRTGTMHLLAISGLHIGLLGAMVTFVFISLARRSEWLLLHTHIRILAGVLTLPLLLIYAGIAGMNTPVFRALVMAVLAMYALVTSRQKNLLHLVAAAALLILVCKPLALVSASFQLSITAVLSIALILPRLDHLFTSSHTKQRHPVHVILTMMAVSCAASLGTLPVMIYHFHYFSLAGPIMNLVAEPLLCFWALPAGLAAVPLSYLFPDAAAFILNIGSLGIMLTGYCIEAAAKLPFAVIDMITPNTFEIVLYYTFIAIFLIRGLSFRYKVPLLIVIPAVLALSLTSSLWQNPYQKTTDVSFLDVGQGSASLITLPDGKKYLIDGGGPHSQRFNVGNNVIGPFLRRSRIWRLDAIVITHPDGDHYNGIFHIIDHFSPAKLYVNGQGEEKPSYAELLAYARKKGVSTEIIKNRRVIAHNQNFSLASLGVNSLLPKDENLSSNDRSLVFILRHGTKGILFTGDITQKTEKFLLAGKRDVHADILLAPHHGSITSSSSEFLDAVQPRAIVVSSGYGKKGFPHRKHVEKWKKRKIQVLITAQDGTVICSTDGTNLHILTVSGKRLSWQ